eukprot:COSAG01_NODE_3345_length_6226_cov_40.305043_6_plen_62_part_00
MCRYQLKQAYIAHQDTFPLGQSSDHNWDPLNGGTNRFATIFLYHAMPPLKSDRLSVSCVWG